MMLALHPTLAAGSGKFIDLSLLIKRDQLQQHDYAVSVQSATASPTFCVSPVKARPSETLSFVVEASIPGVYVGLFDAAH